MAGRKVEDGFDKYMKAVFGKTTISEIQEKELMKSFFAGAIVMKDLIFESIDDDNEDRVQENLEALDDEINTKFKDFARY